MAVASAYLRELYAITQSVRKWCHYLLGRYFVIKSNHRGLRELMTQVAQTQEQQFYLTKLLGYDYVIVYRTWISNGVADALSCKSGDEARLQSLITLGIPLIAVI